MNGTERGGGTIQVDRHRTPKWVGLAVRESVNAGHLPTPFYSISNDRDAFRFAVGTLGTSWVDHAGTIVWKGHQLLVSEPYKEWVDSVAIADLEKFVQLIGGVWSYSEESQHFPGRTVRFVVAKTQEVLDDYAASHQLADLPVTAPA